MANNFLTNVFKTQENVNQENMNYTVADKDQKLSAFFVMPPKNTVSGIFPGVICNGIGTINNQFGFNSSIIPVPIFSLTTGIIRFPDAILANDDTYGIKNQAGVITQFVGVDPATVQLTLTPATPTALPPGSYYLIATLNVISNNQYQFNNVATYSIITIAQLLPPAPPNNIYQLALCLIVVSASNTITISTDANCAINYGTIQYQPALQLLQQGRLTGISGSPYGDTPSDNSGSSYLYFTPTEQGDLISLYDGISEWVTQSFSEVSLPVGSLIDAPEIVVGSLLPIGSIKTGSDPNGMTISPDGNNAYVTNTTSASVSQYSRDANGILKALLSPTFPTGVGPSYIIVSPDGNNVYVTNITDGTVSQYIRGASGAVTSRLDIASGNGSFGIAISPNTTGISNVYVTNRGSNSSISEYTRGANGRLTLLTTLTTRLSSWAICISPDGLNVYVTNFNDNLVSQFSRSTADGSLTALNTPTISSGSFPFKIIVSPDGKNVYVANSTLNSVGFGSVSQYSRATTGTNAGQLTSIGILLPTGVSPQGISISPDNLSVYVSNNTDSTISKYSRNIIPNDPNFGILTQIDTSIITTTGSSPYDIIVSPDNDNVYCVNSNSNSVSEYQRTTALPPPPPPTTSYDIFVGIDSTNVFTLAKDIFSNGIVTNRTQVDGKWVNANGVTTPTGTIIQSNQALLVGSITVTNDNTASVGKIQSWTGNRSIWNLYNQVSKTLVASQGSIDPALSTNPAYKWSYPNSATSNNYRDQNYTNNTPFNYNTNGFGRLSFILDKLYNSTLFLVYTGSGVSGTTESGITGIIANADAGNGSNPPATAIVALAFAIYNDDNSRSGSIKNLHTLSYSYNYSYPASFGSVLGFNFIQKVEKTFTSGYFSDTGGGLTVVFWC